MPLIITKPAVGSNGWGPTMNTNLDNIKSAVDTNESNLSSHATGEGTKHNAGQISTTDESNVQAVLTSLQSLLTSHRDLAGAGIVHKASQIQLDDGTTLQEAIALILSSITVNTDNVVMSARVREIPGYISIDCAISPANVAPRFYRAIVSKREGTGSTATVVEVLTQDFTASRTNIPFDILSGVDVGDIIYVKCYAYFSDTSYAEANEQSLTYQGYESPIVERVRNLEEGLTLANIVDAVKNSEEILTLLSNSLQNSTTLARKVAEEQ